MVQEFHTNGESEVGLLFMKKKKNIVFIFSWTALSLKVIHLVRIIDICVVLVIHLERN